VGQNIDCGRPEAIVDHAGSPAKVIFVDLIAGSI
jgi:hypothetical protein